jgi:hypothetical protein
MHVAIQFCQHVQLFVPLRKGFDGIKGCTTKEVVKSERELVKIVRVPSPTDLHDRQ